MKLRRRSSRQRRPGSLTLEHVALVPSSPGFVVPTHRADGTRLDDDGDARPRFIASFEPGRPVSPGPVRREVRIGGWAASLGGAPCTVTVYRGREVIGRQRADLPRPDVLAAEVTRELELDDERIGFDMVVDPGVDAAEWADLVVEVDDGEVFTRRPVHVRPRALPGGFLGNVEAPFDPAVTGHTDQVAVFRGWIGSRAGRTCSVRAIPAAGDIVVAEAFRRRPDVEAALGAALGIEQALGFTLVYDLPGRLREPLPIVLEFTDGERVERSGTYYLAEEPALMMLDTFLPDPPAMRELSHRHLRGEGLEFGGLHRPLSVDRRVARMRYADQFDEAGARDAFNPRFAHIYGDDLVGVDFIVDLNEDDLSGLRDEHFDFFVACGVLEHLANPLRFLVNLHDVMDPGALFFLAVPDRDFSFDSRRACTSNEHLWDEFRRGVTVADDAHYIDSIEGAGLRLPDDPAVAAAVIEQHRREQPHLHVWTQESFDDFLHWAIDQVPLHFDVVDRATSREAEGNIVYVLRKRAA